MKINNRFLLSRIKNFYTRNEQKIEIVLNIKKYLYCNNVNKITSVSNHSCPQAIIIAINRNWHSISEIKGALPIESNSVTLNYSIRR